MQTKSNKPCWGERRDLRDHGAVSEACVRELSEGVRKLWGPRMASRCLGWLVKRGTPESPCQERSGLQLRALRKRSAGRFCGRAIASRSARSPRRRR